MTDEQTVTIELPGEILSSNQIDDLIQQIIDNHPGIRAMALGKGKISGSIKLEVSNLHYDGEQATKHLSLIHISEPTRPY